MSYGRVSCFRFIFLWFCGLLATGNPGSDSLYVSAAIENQSDPSPLGGFVKSEIHMGVRFQISLYAIDEAVADRAFAAGFAEISRLEQVFSDYNNNSETRRIDAAPCDSPLELSADMLDLLQKSFELNRDTNGYFDVTLGKLTKLWRTSRREQKSPDTDAIRAAALGVGSHLIELTEQRLIKRPPGVELDFGGIAKGYAADQVLRRLQQEFGITRVLIDASGDLLAGDPPPNQKGWVVGLSRPADDPGPLLHVYLANRALASSGDSTQFLQTDQVRWSHLLNPHTKTPIIGQNLTLVWANDGATADALASALAICSADEFSIITARFPDLATTAYRRSNLEKPTERLQTENWQMTVEENQVPTAPVPPVPPVPPPARFLSANDLERWSGPHESRETLHEITAANGRFKTGQIMEVGAEGVNVDIRLLHSFGRTHQLVHLAAISHLTTTNSSSQNISDGPRFVCKRRYSRKVV